MKVLAIGASRNIGYLCAERLLVSGATVCFLLRRTDAFDNDEKMKRCISSGKAVIIQGDAMKEDDVRRAWKTSASDGVPVDACIFSVGGTPKPTFKGFVLEPANLTALSMANVLATIPQAPQPKLILISSIGLTKASHSKLPLALKPLYGIVLQAPHADKLGMERVVAHCAGWPWKDEEPEASILPVGWQARLPEPGTLKKVLVVRPAFLTDGRCEAEERPEKMYRVSTEELGGYTVSRKDVAHFIVQQALANWEDFEGKIVNVGY